MTTTRDEAIRSFAADRALAHRVLFKHRHPQESCAAHDEVATTLHDGHALRQYWAFRGFAKSTLAEEALVLGALYREFHNGLIVGSSEKRAQERLESVAHELDTNEDLHELFGNPRGRVWAEDRIVLANGVIIQALGRGQKMRGAKYINWRPDFVLLDDVDEDDESRNPDVHEKTVNWLFNVLVPALDPAWRIRVLATPRDTRGLPNVLKNDPSCETLVFPIETYGFDGERVPQWPERFPLAEIDRIKALYERQGKMTAYKQEYMCEIDTGRKRAFDKKLIRVEPTVRAWQSTCIMIDPARTVNVTTSATTGYAAWSWIGSRLMVWKTLAGLHRPSEIIQTAFEWDEIFQPIFLGVEKTGLNEWLMQPFRTEIARRQHALPLKPVEAPKGKVDFILGLQPFAEAGELVLAEEMPDLIAQLESFPSGRIDIPNALAYALRMRPGLAVYEDFSQFFVAEQPPLNAHKPTWLALNAERGAVAGALAQLQEGRLAVVADWLAEGEPGAVLDMILQEARLEGRREPRLVIHPQAFDPHNNLGLVQAARRLKADIYKGGPCEPGRDEIRRLMQQGLRSTPRLQVAAGARWVLNGMAGGYCRAAAKRGGIEEAAEENVYRTMIEALESFAALGALASDQVEGQDRHYATSRDGSRYTSALRR